MAPIAKSTLRLLLLVSVFSSSLATNVNSNSDPSLAARDLNLPQHLDSLAGGLQRRHHHSDLNSRMEKKKRGLVTGLVADLGHVLVGDGGDHSSQAPTSTRSSSGSTPTSGSGSTGGSSNGGNSGSSGSNNNNNNNDNNNNNQNHQNNNNNSGGSSASNSHHAASNNQNSGNADSGSGSASNVNHQSGSNNNGGGNANAGNTASSGSGANPVNFASSSGSQIDSSNNDGSNGSGNNRNLAAQKSFSNTPSSSGSDSDDASSSSSSTISNASSAATNALGSTSSSSTVANGSTGSGSTSNNNGGNTSNNGNGVGESSSEGGKASKTSVVVPIVIVLVVLLAGGLVFWIVKKKYGQRNVRLNATDFQAVGPGYTSPRPISQESFVAGRPQSSGSYLDRPMSEVPSIGVTSQGHDHRGLDGFTIVAPAAVASHGENPFADNVQNGRPISPETDNRTSHFWSSTGHSHEAYLTASDESGGLYYDGSSREGYSNSAVRGLDEAGAQSASGVQGAFSPYQDLQRGSSNSNRNSNSSSEATSNSDSDGQSYEPYSDGPYADDEEESQQTHAQNPFMTESEYNHGLNASGNNLYQGRNSSRWSG